MGRTLRAGRSIDFNNYLCFQWLGVRSTRNKCLGAIRSTVSSRREKQNKPRLAHSADDTRDRPLIERHGQRRSNSSSDTGAPFVPRLVAEVERGRCSTPATTTSSAPRSPVAEAELARARETPGGRAAEDRHGRRCAERWPVKDEIIHILFDAATRHLFFSRRRSDSSAWRDRHRRLRPRVMAP